MFYVLYIVNSLDFDELLACFVIAFLLTNLLKAYCMFLCLCLCFYVYAYVDVLCFMLYMFYIYSQFTRFWWAFGLFCNSILVDESFKGLLYILYVLCVKKYVMISISHPSLYDPHQTHTYIHTYIHTYVRTYIHTYICAYITIKT